MITVLDAGMQTTLQDGGRIGYAHLGVPRAGAADMRSLRHANRLAGNANDRETALEITLTGPILRFDVASVIALTGGELSARLDDMPVPMYQSVAVNAGQVLSCGAVRTGIRSYLAVNGGIRATRVLGSMAADTLSGLGAPVLRKHDVLVIEPAHMSGGFYLRTPPGFADEVCLRVLSGPHQDYFAPETLHDFYAQVFTSSRSSDRTGVRLDADLYLPKPLTELPTQGMVTGAIQVTGDGHLILLLPNHGTTGGYPVIATVMTADHWQLGQLAPGAHVRFEQVTRAQAVMLLREQEQALEADILTADDALLSARALLQLARNNPGLQELHTRQGARWVCLRR
ncbi:MAG TPA: biotin-dependent carboxyltransferase family protein [Gammaproteobacteria bacterium]|nr:biotin-dependent carboxyltransferase family protein [Gammaproteobacteria bacterium]